MVTGKEIKQAIYKTGLSGKIISLHSSLKSFGYVEGGADTVIKSFMDSGCTIIVPTFYYDAQVKPPLGTSYTQNAFDDSEFPEISDKNVLPYILNSGMITKDMGAIPSAVLKMKECSRGNHPINSFAGIGMKSKEIIHCQSPLDVYAPLRKIYDNGGFLLLIGVDLTKATPIHFAEQLAGRRLFRRWAKLSESDVVEAEVGSCSDGFNNLKQYIQDIESTSGVGNSLWRMFSFREFVERITQAIIKEPMITHCGKETCRRCNDSTKGGPLRI